MFFKKETSRRPSPVPQRHLPPPFSYLMTSPLFSLWIGIPSEEKPLFLPLFLSEIVCIPFGSLPPGSPLGAHQKRCRFLFFFTQSFSPFLRVPSFFNLPLPFLLGVPWPVKSDGMPLGRCPRFFPPSLFPRNYFLSPPLNGTLTLKQTAAFALGSPCLGVVSFLFQRLFAATGFFF